MRILIILILIKFSISEDICAQQTSYEECINVKQEQCKWNGYQCQWSNNYLFGCDPTINEKLCVKQLGKLDGTLAMCIFDKSCHTIYEKHILQCTDKLSKSGCLSVTNPDQLCKWEDDQCINLNQTEIYNINTIFQNLELSASVCSRITGFLIIHHQLLWTLLEYSHDVLSEAQKKVQIEVGLQIQEQITYQDSTLKDNYIDSKGQFKWYTISTKLSNSQSKLNDYQRYGCIAQEILNENKFVQLFSLNGTIRGVNHVYCKYLNIHPISPILTVFKQQECQQITLEELQDESYINQNDLQCQCMSGQVCQRFLSFKIKCIIDYKMEYQCMNTDVITENNDCQSLNGIATHYHCASVIQQYCYLDISSSKGQCSQQCSTLTTKNSCENNSQCKWLGENLGNISDSTQSQFLVCVPLIGCNQLGINKIYCQKMSMNCFWNQEIMKCQEIQLIEQLKCEDCNSIYCCSSVTIYDQFCIWKSNQCLNVKDQKLFSHYQSFSSSIIMNYNLCMSQKGQYNYYDINTRTCKTENINLYLPCVDFSDQDYHTDNKICNNGINSMINKELCFALINSNTKWDATLQKCIHITNKSIPCEEFKFVNPNLCKYGIIQNSNICLYDQETLSCYQSQQSQLYCDTPGINQEQCVSNQDGNCQWKDNKCQFLTISQINQYYCFEFQLVSPSVCRYTNENFSCGYDFINSGCKLITNKINSCDSYINNQACFQSQGLCYFDNIINKCLDASSYLNILQCNTEFLSYKTCIGITTLNQNCFWGSIPSDPQIKCRPYQSQFQTNCNSYKDLSNLNTCALMASNLSLTLTEDQFCEVIDSDCVSSTSEINDSQCGYNTIINIHRCVAFTNQNCYFKNNKCNLLTGPQQYQQILLGVLECNQSNLKLCNHITTPNQVCYIGQDKKCAQMHLTFTDSCANLSQYNMNAYNPQLCRTASDACYFDIQNKICQIPKSQQFKCNQIGASKKLCLLYTKENCVFQNDFCQNLTDFSIECRLRNKHACSQGRLGCYWNDKNTACEQVYSDCPTKYENGINWLVCQSSVGQCFAGMNGCKSQLAQVPCWLSLSQTLCIQQQKYCQWLDSRCVSQDYDCEESQSKNECLLHRSNYCVFHQNKCFSIKNIQQYDCEQFEQVSLNFCRQFYPYCYYIQKEFKCVKLNFLSNSQMIDNSFQQYACSYLGEDMYSCIFQRFLKCIYFNYSWYKFCGSSDQDKCDSYGDIALPSILSCEQFPNCKFAMTIKGEPFCYTTPLQCENLQSFCLRDIQGVNCYIDPDKNVCKTFVGNLICENVQSYRVNKQLCLSVMQNPENTSQCYYQDETQLCKIINPIVKKISNTLYDFYSCIFQDAPYLLQYDKKSVFQQCIQYSQDYQTDLNLQGCTQLQDNTYYFNLQYFKCYQEIKEPYTLITLCHQMSRKTCLQLQNHLSCIWVDNKCQKYRNQFINVSCQIRNYNACIKSVNQNCVWIQDSSQCQDRENIKKECDNLRCEYSQYYCQSIQQLWNGNNCYENNTELTLSYFRCDRLGLNRNQCLNNTQTLNCYWNGFTCLEANLDLLECQDDLSQVTCSQIKTPKQICKWINNKCENMFDSNQCSDFSTLSYCRQASISCQYNLSLQKCEPKLGLNETCSNTLSYAACKNVENDFCQFDGYCNYWYRARYSCQNIVNYWGCLNTQMYCKWTGQCESIEETFLPVSCIEIPIQFNKVSCSKYSIEPCLYDEVQKKCDIKLTSSFVNSTDIDQTNYIQIRLIYECTQFNQKEDCVGSRIGYCEWKDNVCLNCESNINCQNNCFNKSIKQCLKMHELYCAWRNDKCEDWVYDMKTYTQSLVTQRCCKQINSTVKYLESISSCVQIDIKIDKCNTLGLSKLACLSLVSQQCIFKGDQCLEYTFEYKTKCKDYFDVNSQVCQQLPHLSCKYDQINNTCVDVEYSQDQCLTKGLSKIGCSKIIQMPCYWNIQIQQCSNFQVQKHINQCDNLTITNSYTCRLLNFHQDVCSYNLSKRTCQSKFNKFAKCSQPGLNRLACIRLVSEPCQYVDDECQKINTLNKNCNDLRDVNELTCRMNIQDLCTYDPIGGNCQYSLQKLPCNYQGINIHNCKRQLQCQWIHDLQECTCQSRQIISICNLNENECKIDCIYEQNLKICRKKKCIDLKNCQGVMNNEICYEDQLNRCQGAKSCEDIINLNDNQHCSDFMFNGSNCIQIMNYCVSGYNLQEICINSDCLNTSCKYDNFTCRPLICSDYIEEEECQKISNCYYLNGQCQQTQTCQDINDQSVCIKTIVNHKQCSWEIGQIYDTKYHCTNNQCYLYSNSPSLCNGNEINQFSCYMNEFQICQNCEDVTDICQCQKHCLYQNGKCQSILCQNFSNENECQGLKKCYWSDRDHLCRKQCRFIIVQEDCELLDYECHWNPYQYKCEEGVQVEVNLSVTLNQIDTYTQCIGNFIIALIFIQ